MKKKEYIRDYMLYLFRERLAPVWTFVNANHGDLEKLKHQVNDLEQRIEKLESE